MDYVEATGKTQEEAVEAALQQLQATADEVNVEVIDEPKKKLGFLGGAGEYRVRVTRINITAEEPAETISATDLEPAVDLMLTPGEQAAAERAQEFLAQTTRLMGLDTHVAIKPGDDGEILLEILGPSLGLLIGRHGATLDALQLLAAVVANTEGERRSRIIVDAENYRERRKEMLRKMALAHADKAKQRGQEVVIPDLKPFERRVIHLALKDDPDIETYSEGEGDDRCLVISPRNS